MVALTRRNFTIYVRCLFGILSVNVCVCVCVCVRERERERERVHIIIFRRDILHYPCMLVDCAHRIRYSIIVPRNRYHRIAFLIFERQLPRLCALFVLMTYDD